jgi:hypothetical protein
VFKKFPISFFTFILFSIPVFKSFGQNESLNDDNATQMKQKKAMGINQNFIKTNITGILIRNYSLQYERTLSKTISLSLAFRVMPSGALPFKSTILNIVGNDDPNTKKTIEDFKLSNTAITPEIRFYLSKKGYGRGFYIAPFYRHANFKSNDIDFFYNDSTGTEQTVRLSGKLSSNTGGILFGVQKFLGKHIVLDIWLLGPHIGSGTGNFPGTTTSPLTTNEQDEIRSQLNDIDIPLTNKTVNVNANGASLKLDGPWGGVRTGLSFGIRF